MKKRKNIAIPMILAATIAAVSVPCSSQIVMASDTYQVGVSKGYLALRSAMAYDSSNEIGELYSGDTVEVTEYTTSDYWYVYSPKLNRSGYVNNDYLYFLSSQPTSSSGSYTVSVAKGYLALRSAKAYDSSNEIGQLYSGDTVTVSDSSDPQYWYVYSPKLNLSGYVNKDYLYYSGDTAASAQSSSGDSRTVSVAKGYLALRSAKAYDSSNEIGQLYSGDTVQLIDTSDSQYWYVYSQKLGKNGYVNKDYLIGGTTTYATRTVSVAKGYLALRSAKAYDSSNEIGQLYSGDTVTVSDSSDPQYWYVYSPKLNLSGYVNKDYLYYSGDTAASAQSSSGDSRTVSVAKGYLALRSAKAYDSSNEIGQLYSGDTVQLIDTSDSQYWYVYSQKLGKNGYVNKDYLIGGTTTYATRTVSVATGYLALRSAKAYDSSNEIGQLYSGDTVQLVDTTDAQYWYIYSQKLCKYGYVNKDYLY